LEGGIASKTYWLTHALAGRGHCIHVVTDREGADQVHTVPSEAAMPRHQNVAIHRPEDKIPWHIPHDEHRALCLLNKTLEVVEKEKPDAIGAGYLVPYGLVAYLAGKITGLPYVLQHGGSDVNKFLVGGLWPELFSGVLANARSIMTDMEHRAEMAKYNARTLVGVPYVPDPAAFSSAQRNIRERPVLALVGKANYHWRHKGWHRVIDIWSRMGEGFDFLVVSQGIGLERFKAYARERLGDRIIWRPFVPAWGMPALLASVDVLFYFETDLPFPVFSCLVPEALFCGTAIVSDQEDIVDRYRRWGLDLSRWDHLLLSVGAGDIDRLKERIRDLAKAEADTEESGARICYERYVLQQEAAFC